MASEGREHAVDGGLRELPAGGTPTRPALMSESQVEAMISLLTDESESVVEGCRRALRAHAEMAEPLLRERLGATRGEEREAVHEALMDVVGARLESPLIDHLVHSPSLEAGSILIGRLVDPSDQPGGVTAALDAMADQLAAEPAARRGQPGSELSLLIEVLVRQNGLRGADPSAADPKDALLHGVTLRQRGLPLPLCITWILVARRVGIPLTGVNMPGHFLVRYERAGRSIVLDPYHGGKAVREEDCRRFLKAAGYPPIDMLLLEASDRDMLVRTLRNLVMIATRLGLRDLAARCARVLSRTGRSLSS